MLAKNTLKKETLKNIVKKHQEELDIISKTLELLEQAYKEIKNNATEHVLQNYKNNNSFPSVIFSNINLKKFNLELTNTITDNNELKIIIKRIQEAIKLYQKRKNYLLYKVRELKML